MKRSFERKIKLFANFYCSGSVSRHKKYVEEKMRINNETNVSLIICHQQLMTSQVLVSCFAGTTFDVLSWRWINVIRLIFLCE